VIFDDAALDQAVEGSSTASTSTRATSAAPGSRLLVQESIYEPLIGKLKRRLETLRVGDPLDKNTDVGAINSKQQLDKIRSSSPRARRRARDLPAALSPSRRRATGSRRPSSRTSRRATASRRRRSSGRSSRC
jgi:acyl-CoA reductase-like NAD-dependent aldehyde dehydrogenase